LTIRGLQFVDHLKAGMIEQDVYVERTPGSDRFFRVSTEEQAKYKEAPVYGTAHPVHHAPFTPDAAGPYPKGRDLGMTLKQWLAGTGTAGYACGAGQGEVKASFKGLVPNGVYTMWHAVLTKARMGCAKCPFATLDIPVGAPDGAQSTFKADGQGSAEFEATFKPCLQLSGARLAALLAIAYHSDGNTYGPTPRSMGNISHVQLFTMLPENGAWTNSGK
jgi:hypothetical protein